MEITRTNWKEKACQSKWGEEHKWARRSYCVDNTLHIPVMFLLLWPWVGALWISLVGYLLPESLKLSPSWIECFNSEETAAQQMIRNLGAKNNRTTFLTEIQNWYVGGVILPLGALRKKSCQDSCKPSCFLEILVIPYPVVLPHLFSHLPLPSCPACVFLHALLCLERRRLS